MAERAPQHPNAGGVGPDGQRLSRDGYRVVRAQGRRVLKELWETSERGRMPLHEADLAHSVCRLMDVEAREIFRRLSLALEVEDGGLAMQALLDPVVLPQDVHSSSYERTVCSSSRTRAPLASMGTAWRGMATGPSMPKTAPWA